MSDQPLVRSNPSIAVKERENDALKWVFISFGAEERGRRATHNVIKEQLILFRPSRQMPDSPLDGFQLVLDSHIISLIQNVQMWKLEKYSVIKTGACRVLRFWLL